MVGVTTLGFPTSSVSGPRVLTRVSVKGVTRLIFDFFGTPLPVLRHLPISLLFLGLSSRHDVYMIT